jgi:hypothetical protein
MDVEAVPMLRMLAGYAHKTQATRLGETLLWAKG